MKPKYYAPLDMKMKMRKRGEEFNFLSKAHEHVTTFESNNAKIILPILSFEGSVDEKTADLGEFLAGLGDPGA